MKLIKFVEKPKDLSPQKVDVDKLVSLITAKKNLLDLVSSMKTAELISIFQKEHRLEESQANDITEKIIEYLTNNNYKQFIAGAKIPSVKAENAAGIEMNQQYPLSPYQRNRKAEKEIDDEINMMADNLYEDGFGDKIRHQPGSDDKKLFGNKTTKRPNDWPYDAHFIQGVKNQSINQKPRPLTSAKDPTARSYDDEERLPPGGTGISLQQKLKKKSSGTQPAGSVYDPNGLQNLSKGLSDQPFEIPKNTVDYLPPEDDEMNVGRMPVRFKFGMNINKGLRREAKIKSKL